MSLLGIEKLNRGLTRLVSLRPRPEHRPQYVEGRKRGRVFRIGTLHNRVLTQEVLQRNRRGFFNAQLNTVAFAPSLYHWLFHRCGVPFAESQLLVEQGRLRVNDVVVSKARDLEHQFAWDTLQSWKIELRPFARPLGLPPPPARSAPGQLPPSSFPTTSQPAADPRPSSEDAEGWIPALHRARHRLYYHLFFDTQLSRSSEEAEPRSFVHRVQQAIAVGPEASLGLNVLRPSGFIDGLAGLALVSNDVATVRFWNNELLGNYGVYDLRFPRGIPAEVVETVATDVREGLQSVFNEIQGLPFKVPHAVLRTRVPAGSRDLVESVWQGQALHPEERLLVTTPLLPYRVVRRLKRLGVRICLIRAGPFELTGSLLRSRAPRPLSSAELGVFFSFERRLKVNRMVLSLREFDADAENRNRSQERV